MPMLRYFVVVGLALVGLLFAADYFVPKQTVAAAAMSSDSDNTLASWRASEARKSMQARTTDANNFTQSFAAFAPAPAFGLRADERALATPVAQDVPAKSDIRADATADTRAAPVKAVAQDAPPRKPRRQVAQANIPANANPGRAFVMPQPSVDSLRQDAINRTMTRDAMRTGQRQAFTQPQWPQQQWPQQPGLREANARTPQGPFAPRMW